MQGEGITPEKNELLRRLAEAEQAKINIFEDNGTNLSKAIYDRLDGINNIIKDLKEQLKNNYNTPV